MANLRILSKNIFCPTLFLTWKIFRKRNKSKKITIQCQHFFFNLELPKYGKCAHPIVLNISRMDWQYMFV